MPATRTSGHNSLGPVHTLTQRALVCEVYATLSAVLDSLEIEPTLARDLKQLLGEAETDDLRQPEGAFCLLPLLTCEAVGADPRRALAAAAAWRALDMAAKVLDDTQDGDAIRAIGPDQVSRVVNTAPGFYAISVLCLGQLPRDDYFELSDKLHRTILRMAGAQHQGFVADVEMTVEESLRIIGEKTGSHFGLAARLGGRCATADSRTVNKLYEFGFNAGVVLQLIDDLADFHNPGPDFDIAGGHRTLPIIYALSVAAPKERYHIKALLARAPSDPLAEEMARQMMLDTGAHSYLLTEIARYRRRALEAIEGIGEEGRSVNKLRDWLSWLETAATNR